MKDKTPTKGWKLVPVEPTAQMLEVGLAACSDAMDSTQDSYSSWDYPTSKTAYKTYKAMLAAAPEPQDD